MSSLIVCHDLHIMMLELSVEKLLVPDSHVFDAVTLRKTTIMFRMFDNNWIELQPQQENYRQYNGSTNEVEYFYGGKSVVFAISEGCLKHGMSNANIKIRVFKEISKYFEVEPCYDAGVTYIDIHSLFHGIVKELKERQDMQKYFTYFHEREPISKSMKGTFTLTNESNPTKSASMNAYIRLSYFGKSIITELDRSPEGQFYVSEEMYEGIPYQCLELTREELENGCWRKGGFDPPLTPQHLVCECTWDKHETVVRPSHNATIDSNQGRGDDQNEKKTSPTSSTSPTARDTAIDTTKKLDLKRKIKKEKIIKNDTTDEFDDTGDGVREDGAGPNDRGTSKRRKKLDSNSRPKMTSKSKDKWDSEEHKSKDKWDIEEYELGDKWNSEDHEEKRHKDIKIERKRRRRLRDETQSNDAELISDRTRRPRVLEISDAKKREHLKGNARGAVTIGLTERVRKCAKISTSISKCAVSPLVRYRCCCPAECQIVCPVVMWNYQNC